MYGQTAGDVLEHYDVADERPHPADPQDPYWQESIFFFWWDDEHGIGAIHRIGHEPGATPPAGNAWNGVFTRDGARFRRFARPPLEDRDRTADGLSVGPSRYAFDDRWRFWLEDPDCELELEWYEDFVGLPHMYPKTTMGDVHDDYAPQHYEASGRVRGTARIGQERFSVDALAYRDHSWGRREWSTLLAHRYLAGTVGPEFTFCTLGWLGIDGRLAHFGLLIRDGVFQYAECVDFLTYLEPDGTSHRAGVVTFHMPDGEAVTLRPKLVDAVLHEHGGEGGAALSAVDSICIVEYNGMRGFGNFEITNNAKNGADPVRAVTRAVAENGLSRRTWRIAEGGALE
jgi:hypothetical protein